MKQSVYNVYFKSGAKNYVFNTWSGSLVSLDDSDYISLLENNIPSAEDKEQFRKLGILTEGENEFKNVFEENRKNILKRKDFSIVIAPTFKCNAHCGYCFEKGIESKDLDDATCKSIVDYIKNSAQNKKVRVTWFGGEPLLASDRITELCKKFDDNGISFSSSMITNGYLLDRYIYEMVTSWRLRRIQITLDGLEEKYNAVKGLGDNAFKKIISNIHLAVDNGIKVSIRINFDSTNYGDYENIIKFVYNEFENSVNLYFHDIIGENFATPNEIEPNPNLAIYSALIKYGYVRNLKDLRIKRTHQACAINADDFIIVCPDGSATKCEHHVGRKNQFSVGNINDKDFNPAKQFNVLQKDCGSCVCFPICGGGCISNHLMKKGGGCTRVKSAITDILKLYIGRIYNEDNFD